MMIFASYGWELSATIRSGTRTFAWRGRRRPWLRLLWSAEHHFFDYSFCPDNLQLMTYLAGVCPDIDPGTAAVILPWHDPLRVAEQAAVLDHRARAGCGSASAAAWRGASSPRSVARWTKAAGVSTRRRR